MDIRDYIKCYQDTLSYTSSKVDYSMGQNIYMLPSDMNLKTKTGTVGYNNKILICDKKFILGKNDEVNLMPSVTKSHKDSKTNSLEPTTIESHLTTTQGLGPGGTPLHRTHTPTIMKMRKFLGYFLGWNIYSMVQVSMNSVPQYIKFDTTLHMPHTMS